MIRVEKQKKNWKESIEFIYKLGHNDSGFRLSDYLDRGLDDHYTKKMIGNYQKFNGLKDDEILGDRTEIQLSRPRCSLPDIMERRESVAKWGEACQHRITVAWDMPGQVVGLTDKQIDECFEWAFDLWEAAADIKFERIKDLTKAMIYSRWGRMGRGTLAWSYLADGSCSARLQQEYNRSVAWSIAYLREVIAHEIGHALGLGHLMMGNIMQPTGSAELDSLGPQDLREIIRRYDEAKTRPTDPTDPTDPTSPPIMLPGEQRIEIWGTDLKIKRGHGPIVNLG